MQAETDLIGLGTKLAVPPLAEAATAAADHRIQNHLRADLRLGYPFPQGQHDPNGLMAKDHAWPGSSHLSLNDRVVGGAEPVVQDLDEHLTRARGGPFPLFQRHLAWTMIESLQVYTAMKEVPE